MPISPLHPVRKIVILGCVVLFLAAVQPFLWQYVQASIKSWQSKQLEKEQFSSIGSDLNTLKTTLERQEQTLGDLSVVFPKRGNTSQVVERLERLADQEGVAFEIKSIAERQTAVASEKLPGLIPLRITIEAFGSVEALLEYIEKIEHTPELTTVDSWTIQSFVSTDASEIATQRHKLVAVISFYLMDQ